VPWNHISFVSPKDVCIFKDNQRVARILRNKLGGIAENDRVSQAVAWNKALLESMQVTSGEEAIDVCRVHF
jgi:hypothetical protein